MSDVTIVKRKKEPMLITSLKAGFGFEYEGRFFIKVESARGETYWNAVDVESGLLVKLDRIAEVYPVRSEIRYDYI